MIATIGHLPSSFSGILLLIALVFDRHLQKHCSPDKSALQLAVPPGYPLWSSGGLGMLPLGALSRENLAYTNLTKR
jgi:hypothetical protein